MVSLLVFIQTNAITFVYNLQLRRIFEQMTSQEHKYHWLASAIPIIYARSRTIDDPNFNLFVKEKRLSVGPLLNARYIPSRYWWFEFTTAFEKEHGSIEGTINFSRSKFGMDDIVLTGARVFYPIKNMQYVVYGLAGFPVNRKIDSFDAQETFIGTRFFGMGAGSELSYNFINNPKTSFMGLFQNRIVHFFSRNWFPILPEGSKIHPGDFIDLLFALRYRRGLNSIEMGFDQTFFINQGFTLPTRTIKTKEFARQIGYCNISHIVPKFPLLATPVVLGAGIIVGYTKKFNAKLIIGSFNFTAVF